MTKKPIKLVFTSIKPEILEEYIDEKTGERAMKVKRKFQHKDLINRNGRRYRGEILQRELDRLAKPMEEGGVFGASYHPKGADAEINDVSHIWHKAWIEKDGSCVGEATIIPTKNGQDAMTIIKHGGKICLSSRGYGTVTKKTEMIDGAKVTFEDVNDDYRMLSPGDMVLTPSVPDATIQSVIEKHVESSYNEEEPQDKKPVDSDITSEDVMEIKDIKKLKEENADAFNKYEDELHKDFLESEAFTKAVESAVSAKKDEWKAEISTELQEALEEIDGKLKQVKEALKNGRIDKATEILDGMIESESEEENEEEDNTKSESEELEALKKTNAELKKAKDALETEKADREEAEKTAKAEEALQIKLKAKVEEVLGDEKYKPYKALIEEEIFKDEKVVGIEDPEKTEEVIEAVRVKLSEMKVKLEKVKITDSDLKPKGKVENQDEDPVGEAKKAEKALKEQYLNDKHNAGCKLTFEEYKDKFGNK